MSSVIEIERGTASPTRHGERVRARRRRFPFHHPAPARTAVLDAVVVGSGPAGLSAALVLGRARRHVLVLAAELLPGGLTVTLGDGAALRTRALVLAHGLRYDPPPLPGIAALWGRSVFHCPFCDGWEVRDRPRAVHGNGAAAARSALVIAGWSGDVVLCTDGPADLDRERA